MKKESKIIRSTVSLATLHNRRDFSKRFSTLEKFAKPCSKLILFIPTIRIFNKPEEKISGIIPLGFSRNGK